MLCYTIQTECGYYNKSTTLALFVGIFFNVITDIMKNTTKYAVPAYVRALT